MSPGLLKAAHSAGGPRLARRPIQGRPRADIRHRHTPRAARRTLPGLGAMARLGPRAGPDLAQVAKGGCPTAAGPELAQHSPVTSQVADPATGPVLILALVLRNVFCKNAARFSAPFSGRIPGRTRNPTRNPTRKRSRKKMCVGSRTFFSEKKTASFSGRISGLTRNLTRNPTRNPTRKIKQDLCEGPEPKARVSHWTSRPETAALGPASRPGASDLGPAALGPASLGPAAERPGPGQGTG